LIATAFGGVSGGGGESQAIYDGVSEAITGFGAGGGNQGSNRPAAYINYLLFDKDYNPLDMGYTVVPDVTFTKQQLSIPTLNIEEEGYVFVYLSYDNDSPNWVYFDDFKVTHTKSNVIQYNEYYPFGLQTSNSWTRESNENNYLYNAGSEINTTSGLYDLPFRNYDASLGRFFQVDPLAHLDNSKSAFAYGGNNPVYFNDPMGLKAISMPTERPWSYYNRYAVPTNRADAMTEWGNEWSNDIGNSYADPGGYGIYVEYRYYWKTDGNGKAYDDRVEAEYKRHIEYEWIANENDEDPGECPPGIDCSRYKYTNTDDNGSQWYSPVRTDHHLGKILEYTRDKKIIEHDVYVKNMSAGIKETFLEAFPIFKTEFGQDLAEDATESILEQIIRWPIPIPIPFFPPIPSIPETIPGWSVTPKLSPK
jgi:RHS repeat-associated protein